MSKDKKKRKDDDRKKAKKKRRQQAEDALTIKPGTPSPPAPAAELPPFLEGPARAMVVMAHPDDAEFLCGGTVAKWCSEGWDVTYVVVTGGDKGTHDPEMYPEKLAAIREEEQRAACRALGVRECVLLGYPDGYTADNAELRGQVVRLLRLYRPDVVITWDAFRHAFNHRDHRTVGMVTSDAIYPLVRDRLFYPGDEEDGLESHQVDEVLLAGADNPDFTVDVTDVWEKKVEAILCHASQVGGRTREDFVRERAEREEKEGPQPMLERFRRWSIRRPQRRPAEVAKPGEAGEDTGGPGEAEEAHAGPGAEELAAGLKGQREA